jgi:predicted AAA+ superfamily ATPase
MEFKKLFKEILSEYYEEQENPFIARDLAVYILPKKATVITGVRRCGKSVFTEQVRIKEELLKHNTIRINFSDERLDTVRSTDLNEILEAFYSMSKFEPTSDNPLLIVLDEIQLIEKWELFVDRLLRNSSYRVIITGSSSHLLSSEIATQMRGRGIRWELFPFSFNEYLKAFKFNLNSHTSKNKAIKEKLLDKFIYEGGFPEVVNQERTLQIKILQEYYDSILYKDIIERSKIANPGAAKALLKILIGQMASLITMNKLFERLKSQGYHIHKSFVNEILTSLEDAYIIYLVSIFTTSPHKQMTNPKKIYLVDTGFANSLMSGFSKNRGRAVENCVFLHLRRYELHLTYYKTASSKEVDFSFYGNKNETHLILIQVCSELLNKETVDREVSALGEALSENKNSKGYIVFVDKLNSQDEVYNFGKIKLLQLSDFLLCDPTRL